MVVNLKGYRIFIATPRGLDEERKASGKPPKSITILMQIRPGELISLVQNPMVGIISATHRIKYSERD